MPFSFQRPKFSKLTQWLSLRSVYSFDGIDDRCQLQFRAIDPDGDIDIEFKTGPVVPAAGGQDYAVMSQCLTATFGGATGKEFTLYFNSAVGALQVLHGGNFFSSAPIATIAPNKTYRWTLQGSTQTFYVNGSQVFSGPVTRGAAREPTAVTVLCAQTHGGANSFRAFASGVFYGFKINGTLWPMNERDYTIQLPSPSGLGAELITQSVLENPVSKGSQWTYLGDGRWQYIGDGTANGLQFLGSGSTPTDMMVEFEVESFSGSGFMRTTSVIVNNGDRLFNTVGKKRFFFTGDSVSAVIFERNSAGQVISCVIKNISFKPLVGFSPNKAAGGDFSNQELWSSNNASVSVNNGSLSFTNAGVGHRVAQTAEILDNRTYEITYTIGSLLSGSVRCRLIGVNTVYDGVTRTAAGTYTETVTVTGPYAATPTNRISFEARSAATTATLIDDLTVREITTCNPMTMVNTTSDRWQEV